MRTSVLQAVHRRLLDGWPAVCPFIRRTQFFQSHPSFCLRNAHSISENAQSDILPGEERIHVSRLLQCTTVLPITKELENVHTVYDLLRNSLDLYGTKPCLGMRDQRTGMYEFMDFQQVFERSMYTGAALQEFGISSGNSSFIGINCKNRSEFVFSYMGCTAFSNVFVPLYDNLDRTATKYIISETEVPLYICDTEAKARFMIEEKSNFPKLRTIVTIGRPSRDLVSDARAVGLELLGFLDFEMKGKMKQKRPVKPKPDDIFTICWTSGTTGIPKGVLVTHKNAVTSVSCLKAMVQPASVNGTSTISYMPTGHIYELLIQLQTLGNGGSIGFFGGDVLKLMDDIQALKPTMLPMVPRLLNRLYAKALSDITSSSFKRKIYKTALKQKEKQLKRGVVSNKTIWDKLVFRSVREMFGNEVQIITNSAAPLSPEVFKFFRCALGCYLFDAYGQTELGPMTLTHPNDYEGGNVGAPVPTAEVKLVDVPEMNYFTKDNVGEICARGPTVCQGYFKNPSATKETISADGWLYTGDIGQWLPNGSLRIIDRKKNFFKLSQGEFIAPDKLESSYGQSPFIAQIFVDSLPEQDYVVAVAVPDPMTFPVWTSKKGFSEGSLADLCKNKSIRLEILKHLRNLGSRNGMTSLELIRNVHLHPEMMTIEAGLLTPTLKLKRDAVRKTFQEDIRALYTEGPMDK